MSYIYLRDKHTLLHKWVALNNPDSENYAEICGYVKLSISVVATGDEQIEIKPDVPGHEDPDVLMSPSLNPTFYQIKIRIFQGQELAAMDNATLLTKGGIDAYLKLEHRKMRYRTRTITAKDIGNKKCATVNWNQEFWLSMQTPILEPNISLKVMDHDDIGADETCGTISLPTKWLLECKNTFKWFNVYGSPLGQSSSSARTKMNNNPDFATTFKGRILLQVDS